MERPDVVTIVDAAKILECSERSIRNMSTRGELTKITLEGKKYYLREQVISLRASKDTRSIRLDEVAQLHKLIINLNSYIVRMDARVALLENIIETRDDQTSLGPSEIRVFKEMAVDMLSSLDTPYSEIHAWANDINKLSYEDAQKIDIQLLYVLISHFTYMLTNNSEFLGGWDLHRVKDLLTLARFKILGYAQLARINSLEGPPMIISVLNQLLKKVN